MDAKRPINLNLLTISFPIPAIISILHRLSGAFLFLAIPFFLWILDYSLTSDGFFDLQSLLSNFFIKFLTWLFLFAFLFHWIAGIKHLLHDLNIGTSLKGTRIASYLTLTISIVLALLLGIWLW